MGSEEEKVSPVKSKKRTLKTASQIEALENFYDEHKYPSEPMKAELAAKLGLSEKQIQGWFCHRRSKNKKLLDEEHTIRKNELQSSVNDCASGVRHDSCSSSKQGEHLYDFKEVESQRFQIQAYQCSGSDLRKRYLLARNFSVVDDTSSGSSSASQDMLESDKYLYGVKNVRYSSIDREYENMNIKDKPRVQYMPVLDALYMDEASEHPSILAVKIKLGKMYRMDGPPLGIEFQPLPPGAFDSPLRDGGHEPYYMGDSILQSSQRMPRSRADSRVGRIHGRDENALHSSDSCLRESGHKETLPSLFLNKYACDSSIWNPANQFNRMPDLHPANLMDEFSDSEASEFISNESEARSTRDMRGMPVPHPGYRDRSYSGNVNNKRSSFLQIHDGNQGRYTEDHVVRPHKVFANMAEDEVNSRRKLKKESCMKGPRINKQNDSPARLSSNPMRQKENIWPVIYLPALVRMKQNILCWKIVLVEKTWVELLFIMLVEILSGLEKSTVLFTWSSLNQLNRFFKSLIWDQDLPDPEMHAENGFPFSFMILTSRSSGIPYYSLLDVSTQTAIIFAVWREMFFHDEEHGMPR